MTIKKLTAAVLAGAMVLLTACSDSDSGSDRKNKKKDYYTIGETWTVDGQWSLTVTGMTVGVAVDLSELDPKSTLGYYISTLS